MITGHSEIVSYSQQRLLGVVTLSRPAGQYLV